MSYVAYGNKFLCLVCRWFGPPVSSSLFLCLMKQAFPSTAQLSCMLSEIWRASAPLPAMAIFSLSARKMYASEWQEVEHSQQLQCCATVLLWSGNKVQIFMFYTILTHLLLIFFSVCLWKPSPPLIFQHREINAPTCYVNANAAFAYISLLFHLLFLLLIT